MANPQQKDDGRDRQVVDAVAAFIGDAEHMAQLVHGFLTNWFKGLGLGKKQPCLPAEFLLELAGIIRVAQWQRAGLLDAMGEKFPPWQDLLEQLMCRLMDAPASFCLDARTSPAPLCRRSALIWFRRCSWSACREVGVDLVIRPLSINDMLTAVAKLLWKYRHLSQMEPPNG